MIDQLATLRTEREALTLRIKEAAVALFTEGTQTIFEKYPKLDKFYWRQYTPYFNDGEPCEFSAQTDYIGLVDIHGNVEDEVCEYYVTHLLESRTDYRGNPATPTDLQLIGLEVVRFLQNFTDEEFLMMFGDHAEVVVYRDGSIMVDRYEHD